MPNHHHHHHARTLFWSGYLVGWFSCLTLGAVLTVVAWIGGGR